MHNGGMPVERLAIAAPFDIPEPDHLVTAATGEQAAIRAPGHRIHRAVCPASVSRTSKLSTSHSLTVRSRLPLARVRPSGAKATDQTGPLCPLRIRVAVPD